MVSGVMPLEVSLKAAAKATDRGYMESDPFYPEPSPAPKRQPRFRIKSSPHGDGGWIHRIVYVKAQSYKDPKRLETVRTGLGPFRDHKEARAALEKLNR